MSSVSTDRLQGVNVGAAVKVPCRLATTANITLSGLQTIDGVVTVQDDRVLVKNQTTSSQNGIYLADSGAWERDKDWDGSFDVKKGTVVHVTEGATYTRTWWEVTTSDPITPGTTGVTIIQGITDSAIITFLPSGTAPTYGWATRTVASKLSDVISVKDVKNQSGIAVAGDGVQDDTTGIQAAINFAVLTGRRLLFPTGIYKISSTLLVYSASTYVSLRLEGEHSSNVNTLGVGIDHSAILTGPAIAVQGARNFESDRIQYIGPNTYTPTDQFAESQFIVGGIRNSQFSPQCAICIDPFKNGAPADGGYPALSAYYTSAALTSTRAVVTNARFKNQLVSIMVSPSGNVANAENLRFENIVNEQCKIPLALGQLQSKGVVLASFHADQAYCVVDTWSFGARNGSPGFHWLGGDVSRSTYLVRTLSQAGAANSVTQKGTIQGVYAESIWSIGFVGQATATSYIPFTFRDCDFWFATDNTQRKDAQLVNFAPTDFDNCQFNYLDSVAGTTTGVMLKFFHSSATSQKNTLSFRKCKFFSILPTFNLDSLHYVKMDDCTQGYYSNVGFKEFYKLSQLNDLVNQNQQVWPGCQIWDGTNLLYVKPGMNSAAMGTPTFTKSGGGGTFTAADVTILQVLDIVYQTNHLITQLDGTTVVAANWPLGVISNVSGTTITLAGVSENAASGVLTLTKTWYGDMHNASTVTTHTSTTIEINDGGSGRWYSPQNIIAAGIPAGAYIASGTYPNFVLSKAATASATVRAYDADAVLVTKAAF